MMVAMPCSRCLTYWTAAITSCTNGTAKRSAIPIPTDPVTVTTTSGSHARTGGGIVQQAGDDSVDVGLMAPVVAECHFAPWVEYHYFGRGRTDIQAKPVAVVVHIVSSPFIFHRNRTMTGTAGAGPCVHTYRSFLWR